MRPPSKPRTAPARPPAAAAPDDDNDNDDAAADASFGKPAQGWRLRLYAVIFESETRAGRLFDLALIAVILLGVLVVMLDSVQSLRARWGGVFTAFEWGFTALFTIEYVARLACLRRPWRYARSFYGVVDLLALLPTYLAILSPDMALLIDVRILRLLRVFRIFKLSHYAAEYRALATSLAASRRKILVFVGFVAMVVLVLGTLMYVIEGPQHGFTSIPVAVYWAITTMTTVGFGDLAPQTPVGRALASVMMLLGWGVLAVPTGIVSAEMVRSARGDRGPAPPWPTGRGLLADTPPNARACTACGAVEHAADARFCRRCGRALSG